jgi:8-oxo-dGTP pyrophosphatase MutT (NUDIX family)
VIEGLLARLGAALDFRPEQHLPVVLAHTRLGWMRRESAERLRDWPNLFECSPAAVAIRPAPQQDLTDAMAAVAKALSNEGLVRGWRGETYAVRGGQGAVASFHIERAAMRFFGFTSSASHLNGFRGERIFIGRRAKDKAIDPGMLDTLVGGGIPSGQDAWQTLVRECAEEAGIPKSLAERAERSGTLQVCRDVPDGVHSEILFVHDLALPVEFTPRNEDGEVSEFMALEPREVIERVARGEFTVEAGLVAADFVVRRGLAGLRDERIGALLERCRGARY